MSRVDVEEVFLEKELDFVARNFGRCLLCLHVGQKIFPKSLESTNCFSNTLKMLYLIGLGLGDETDITVKGLSIVKKAARVYLEAYTSILLVDKSVLVRLRSYPAKGRADADAQ